ncbi:MAG: terminase large subunit [Gammaproteobacteria bacterium]|nr:terminase large subunit [Gammaproteobacteria bacterium]
MALDFSCLDWAEKLERGETPIPDLPLDKGAVAAAVAIFDNLRLPDVDGFPTLKEACGEWYRDLVRAAFGSIDAETRERFITEIFCLVPKKNSKTTYSAGLGLTALLVNKEPNATMIIVGPTKELADICFSKIKGMIEADPIDPSTGRQYLEDRFHVSEGDQTITDRMNGTELKVKSFDKRVVTGAIPSLVIIEELHILGENPRAQKILAQLRGGMLARPDALMLFITTQSDDPPAGVFKSELSYARRVRDGQVKGGSTLPVLYEFPEEIQASKEKLWRDPKYWPMVMPNIGRSITLPRMLRLYNKALEDGDAAEMIFASQHLNIDMTTGTHSGAWVGANYWRDAAVVMTFDELLESSEVVVAGIDGGGLDDLFGLGVIGRHRETKKWTAWGRAWAQPKVLEVRKDIASRLLDFKSDGDLVICEDPTADLREIAEYCGRIADAGLFPTNAKGEMQHGIGLDPWGVAALVDELAAVKLEGDLLTAIGQGVRLSPAVWGMERKLNDGTMRHCGQPLMDWCVSNAKTEQRGNAVLITKAISGKAKIDPLIGVLNAFMLMARNPVAAGNISSPWDDPDFTMHAK